MEDHKSEYEHSSNYGDTDFGVVGKLGCDSHQHCAEEGCTFTENIIDSEVFARFVLRNDPGKMRSRECLNCPLEDCYEYSKEPEFPCFIQLQGEGSDSDIPTIDIEIRSVVRYFFVSFPNRIENGKATI